MRIILVAKPKNGQIGKQLQGNSGRALLRIFQTGTNLSLVFQYKQWSKHDLMMLAENRAMEWAERSAMN
jgi:hypothetical protein